MNELYLGVGGAGAVVIAGVMIYNAWQAAKVRRRLPRPMPADAETTVGRVPSMGFGGDHSGDERPFIEPTAAATHPASAGVDSVRTRREPSFGGAAGSAADAPRQAVVPAIGEAYADANFDQTTLDQTAREAADQAEIAAPVSAPAAAPAVSIIDHRIDCIVTIRLGGPVSFERLAPLAQRLRRAGSKPVFIEGRPEERAEGAHTWEALQAGARYDEIRAGVQLANRSGALNELEFSEFVTGVQFVADAIDGSPDFPDMLDTVQMARELDGFAAQCDAQLSVNVVSDGAPWSANYVQAIASQDGLLLSRDGTRFVKLDARQNPVFMLQFEDTNFLRDDLTYKGGEMITLLLDVPVADEDILPFRLMCDYAVSLSQRIGGHVVDDQRRPLSESALLAIEKQLMTLYARLEKAGIAAGSPVARRLFSN
jgi:ZipA, C-terminal FtsZ-binding domain